MCMIDDAERWSHDDAPERRGHGRSGRHRRGRDELPRPEDDGEELCFGSRRAVDCGLDFLGGSDPALHLGDGEDLP